MKNHIIAAGLIIVLAAVSAGVTGCADEVRSAVVAERTFSGNTEKEEKTAKATETEDREGDASLETADVLGQVQAPEIYKADFAEYYQEPDWGGSENSKMKISISVDAPVEVPDVEAVRIKKVTRVNGEAAKNIFLKLPELLGGGEGITIDDTTEPMQGKLTVGDLPYSYSIWGLNNGDQYVSGLGFYWGIDMSRVKPAEGGFKNEDTGTIVPAKEAAGIDEAAETADTIVGKMGLKDFKMSYERESSAQYNYSGGESQTKAMYDFYYERIVDGVPVNYVLEGMYNSLYQADEEMMKMSEAEKVSYWPEECLQILMTSGTLAHVRYENPVEVGDYSDEKLFLVPFEEVKNIFEDTIISKIVGTGSGYTPQGGDFVLYPGSIEGAKVDVVVDRVKMGYMRIRDEGSESQWILVPVWDFYGRWSFEIPEEDGTFEEIRMDYSNVSLLTVDARDGTIMERDYSPSVS
ncbi:MAG: DUF6034 family protein [Eubacteriales bacterium]|nr:DUF6034 family protein [Eubacteriales bacterium]